MTNRLTILMLPGIFLTALWGVCFLIPRGALSPHLRHYSGEIMVLLNFVVVPFTVVAGVIAAFKFKDERKLRIKDVSERTLFALLLSAGALILWPRMLASYTFVSALNDLRWIQNSIDVFLEDEAPYIQNLIPIGETELRMATFEDSKLEIYFNSSFHHEDPWGNPYILVAEERENRLWLGAFSRGKDGVSHSAGNDPDDINTWDDDPVQFYTEPINRRARREFIVKLSVTFAFFLTICLCAFRPKARTAE